MVCHSPLCLGWQSRLVRMSLIVYADLYVIESIHIVKFRH